MGMPDKAIPCIMGITQEAIRLTRYRIQQGDKRKWKLMPLQFWPISTPVDSWIPIDVFNLSTSELDNCKTDNLLQNLLDEILQRCGCKRNSVFEKWVQFGCNFEMWEKEKSRKSLIYRTLSWALQDGLEPTTPWLTVRCSNQLSYWSRFCC